MSDLVSRDDLKKVFLHGQAAEGNLIRIRELKGSGFGFSAGQCQQIVRMLMSQKLCYLPRESLVSKDPTSDDFCVVVRDQELAVRLKSIASVESYQVFQTIELSGRVGITSRDLTREINDRLRKTQKPPAQPAVINRCLKSLESDKFIKCVKSVALRGRKVFVLYNVDPDTSVVGGAWYRDGEFDSELVAKFTQKIEAYVGSNRKATRSAILQFIAGSELGSLLGETEIDSVLRILCLDQVLLKSFDKLSGDTLFTAAVWPSFEDIERLPCASCPHQLTCKLEQVDRFEALVLRRKPEQISHTITDAAKRARRRVEGEGGDTKHTHTQHTHPPAHTSRSPAQPTHTDSEFVDGPENCLAGGSLELTSKITPATCPYFNQWLNIYTQPWVPAPEAEASAGDAGAG